MEVVREDEAVVAEIWPLGGRPPPQRRASQHNKKEKSVDKAKADKSVEEVKEKDAVKLETVTSFSTGPKSIPTHWKQTLFLLKEPFVVDEGTHSCSFFPEDKFN